jgi:hypothetical protein
MRVRRPRLECTTAFCAQREHVPAKPTTGCSTIPFGATPLCPCWKSKKPTPVIVAVPRSWTNSLRDGEPQPRINASRACGGRKLGLRVSCRIFLRFAV